MPINDSIIKLRGRLGDLIFYRRNGKNFVRSAPVTVKQTTATKAASADFGHASKAARVLRRAIAENIPYLHYDGSYVNRLNSVMGSVLREDKGHARGKHRVTDNGLELLEDFKINSFAPLRIGVEARRYYDGTVAVTIANPQLQIGKKVDYIQFRLLVLLPDFGLGMCKTGVSEVVTVKPGHDGSPVVLEAPALRDRNAIVVLEVMSFADGFRSYDRRWNVADVVAVLRPVKKDTPAKTFDMRIADVQAPLQVVSKGALPVISPLDS